ncbi:MAG: hypothetical protein GY757_62225 [bacterium]|nr:hypothetical protein [bacterium]
MVPSRTPGVILILLFLMVPGILATLLYGPLQAREITESPGARPYDYVFSLPLQNNPNGYTRMEIESFLCASIINYIGIDDICKNYVEIKSPDPVAKTKSSTNKKKRSKKGGALTYDLTARVPFYYTKYKNTGRTKKASLENLEINKWFEKKVFIVCKGKPHPGDGDTVKKFFHDLNKIVGREQFLFRENQTPGNIVIDFTGIEAPDDPLATAGMTVCLVDNLHVAFYREGGLAKTQSYVYPGQKRRVITIEIANIADAGTRERVITHELLHAVGFNGHSPYPQCRLFPIYVQSRIAGASEWANLEWLSRESARRENATENKARALGESPLQEPGTAHAGSNHESSPNRRKHGDSMVLAKSMLEMLYRPEILQGMTIKETAQILPLLKRRAHTTKSDIKSFLSKRFQLLENQETLLMKMVKDILDRKEKIPDLLKRLAFKKKSLFKEVLKENNLASKLIKNQSPIDILLMNRVEIKKRILNNNTNPEPDRESLAVLAEILDEVHANERQSYKLKSELASLKKQEKKLNLQIKRNIRQKIKIKESKKGSDSRRRLEICPKGAASLFILWRPAAKR